MDKRTAAFFWVVQGLLAALFLFAGGFKLLTPAATLAQQAHMSGVLLKIVGVFEVLGALGLILPGLLRVRPELTPLAAAGLVIITICATVVTLMQGQGVAAAFPAITGVFCVLVVYGRWPRRATAVTTM
jgi:DoxX-like protein